MSSPAPAPQDLIRSIDVLLRTGEFNAAHDQLAALIAARPDFVEALRLYAGTKQALGDVDGAERILRRAFDLDPNWAPTLAALGELLLNRGNIAEAEPLLRRAAQRLPQAALALSRHEAVTRVRNLVVCGKLDHAETVLRDCLRTDPLHADAHDHLARLVWMRTGDAAQTTAALDEVLRRFPDDVALHATKAAILQGAGDARGAHACLAALAERGQAPPALLVRAGLAALEFDPALAHGYAERAASAMPENTAARSLLAAALLGLGDAQAALPHCGALRAAAADDQYFIALQTTAWRLLDDPRYHEYCDYAQWVLPQRLETPPGWPNLAAFFADLGRSLDRLHDPHGHALLFQSLRHGTETTQDLSRSDDPAIRALFAAFDAPIRLYLDHIRNGPEPLRRGNNGGYRFNGSWSVRLRSAGFHTNHVHPRGWISSACYIELPDINADANEDAGRLTFGEPSLIITPALHAEHAVHPEVGMLVLFPSYFWHGTVPFTSQRTRLTVAFDVVPER